LNNLSYPTVFSQSSALLNTLQLGAYLRITYSGGIFTPSYRQTLTASWSPVFAVGQSSRYGGAIPASQFFVGIVTNNWSAQRGVFSFPYVSIYTASCANPGSARYIRGGPTVISGLSGGSTYAVQVLYCVFCLWIVCARLRASSTYD
jgi:hypothetical protein